MRIWEEVILTFILFSASFLLLLLRNTLPVGPSYTKTTKPSSFSPPSSTALESSSSSSTNTVMKAAAQREIRSTEDMGSILSEFSYLFHTFTERELQKVIMTLVDRKERRLAAEAGHRSKRARKVLKRCSLHEIELRVSELGLGYESDETVRFRYCSGRCSHQRRNYDFVMEHMRLNSGSKEKSRRGRGQTHYTPCCRPTKFEKKMSFFDNNDRFYTIHNVSARACACV